MRFSKTTWETGLNSLCSCFCPPVLLPPVVLLQTPGFLGTVILSALGWVTQTSGQSISLFRGCCTLIGQPSLNLGVEAGASWVCEVKAWCSVFPSLTPVALPQAVGAAFPKSLWLHRVGGPLLSKACADPENWGLSGWMCQKPWGPDNPSLRSPVLCGQGAGDFP